MPVQLPLLAQEPPRKPHKRNCQSERILALLKSKEWVTLPEILDLRIANYRARISELRKEGYWIACVEERINGQTHTKYRLDTRYRLVIP